MIKDSVDAYVLAPGWNSEQEEDAYMIMAHIISRHMRHVVQRYTPSEPDNLALCLHISQAEVS